MKVANDVIKIQIRIHTKSKMPDSQWDELQIEDYQYIELADDIDARTFFECMLAAWGVHVWNMVLQKLNVKN